MKCTLPVNFGMGGSYLPLDRHTLMCIGAYPASTAVYALDLHSLILTALLSFSTTGRLREWLKAMIPYSYLAV